MALLSPSAVIGDDEGRLVPAGRMGEQGFNLQNVAILQPKKKPKGGELSELEKEINQWHSSLRIRVEHAIGGVKRYRIVKDKIRNWKAGFKYSVMETLLSADVYIDCAFELLCHFFSLSLSERMVAQSFLRDLDLRGQARHMALVTDNLGHRTSHARIVIEASKR